MFNHILVDHCGRAAYGAYSIEVFENWNHRFESQSLRGCLSALFVYVTLHGLLLCSVGRPQSKGRTKFMHICIM
jgi:hypothetical protein